MAIDAATLASWVADARRRTVALYADLADEALAVPYLRIINPPIWELGHVAWFQERWVLRHALGQPPIHAGGDALWDSAIIAHADRWTAALPDRGATLAYLDLVRARVLEALAGRLDEALRYFTLLSVFHEDMHGEAFAYTRQTLGWPAPRGAGADAAGAGARARARTVTRPRPTPPGRCPATSRSPAAGTGSGPSAPRRARPRRRSCSTTRGGRTTSSWRRSRSRARR